MITRLVRHYVMGEGGYTSDLGLSKKPGTNSQYLK